MRITPNKSVGFTLVELLIALTLGSLIFAFLLQLFIANQRTIKLQLDLSTLIYRTRRVTDILRADIHRAHGVVSVVDGNKLVVNSRTYQVEQHKLIVIDGNHRKTHLVEEVSDMSIVKTNTAVDISLHVAAGSLGKTIHVFTSLK